MRRLPLATVLTALLLHSIPAVVAAADSLKSNPAICSNVTISSAGDARHIARSCPTVTGDLRLAPDLNETVALNGLEIVTGSIIYKGICEFVAYSDTPTRRSEGLCGNIPEPFAFKSTSLRAVQGNLSLDTWLGLSNIDLPRLQRVRGHLNLRSLKNLTQLDMGRLSRVGDFYLEAPRLQDMRHGGLEGFTKDSANLTVRAANLDSLDSLLRPHPKPTNQWPDQPDDWPLFVNPETVALYTEDMLRLTAMTVAWPSIKSLIVNPNFVNENILTDSLAPTLTLGTKGGNSTMSIHNLAVQGVQSLNLHPSLTGGLVDGYMFQLAWTNTKGHFKVPFDNLTILDVFGNDKLESVELPSSEGLVRHLDKLQLSGRGLMVNSLVWPKDNMSAVRLTGTIDQSAFAPFLKDRDPDDVNSTTRPLVHDFAVTGHAGSKFSCTPFDKLKAQNVITGEYRCSIENGASPPPPFASTFSAATALAVVLLLQLC